MKHFNTNFSFVASLIIFLVLIPPKSSAQTKLLVKFGASDDQNVYNPVDFPGWQNVTISDSTIYSDAGGITGTTLQFWSNQFTNFQSISGPYRQFSYGERIIVTWYNSNEGQVNFRPLISFVDTDKPENDIGQPLWYITNDLWIEPFDSLVTRFDITNSSNSGVIVPPSQGNWNIVNISMNTGEPGIICTKIEIGITDTVPPNIPQNVQIDNITYNSIALKWNVSEDNTGGDGLYRYRIYVDGLYYGFSYDTIYTVFYLSSGQNHMFQVTAIDNNKNESAKSIDLNQSTLAYPANQNLIDPFSDLEYQGTYKLPPAFEWMDGDLAYYPFGDSSGTDDHPGSIFCPGIPTLHLVAETSIPEPIISNDTSQLSTAAIIQDFADVKSPNVNDGGGALPKGPAFEWLPQQAGQTQGYLYNCFGDFYQVDGNRLNSFGASDIGLSNPNAQGGWYLGDTIPYSQPDYMTTVGFNFEIPFALNGHKIIAGGSRYGDWHRGPTLVAYGPWNDGTPLPGNNTLLDHTNLLMYENSYGTNWLNGFQEMDEWNSGAWLSTGGKSAVVIAGLKGFGESWYGYYNGEIIDALYCIPTPSEPEDHGPRQSRFEPVLLFYDPSDLLAVANGTMQPYEPQPYASLNIQNCMIIPNSNDPRYDWYGPGGMAYDRQRGYIYIIERFSNPTLNISAPPVIHVWKIKDSGNNLVQDVTVTDGQTACFDALNTITVAGNGTSFIVQNGGSVNMIAGQNIKYFPNTTIQSGGYLLGHIAPSGPFCSTSSIPAIAGVENKIFTTVEQTSFKIYPNPTTGNFILELKDESPVDKVRVDVYGMFGKKVLTAVLNGKPEFEFSLSDKPVGIYFIRFSYRDKSESAKIIKQ